MFVGIYFVFCTICSLQLANGAATLTNDSTGLTPDVSFVSNRLGTYEVPEECQGLNYCHVKPDDYPEEVFDEMFKGKFEIPIYPRPAENIQNRMGDPDEIDDCEVFVDYRPMYKLQAIDGTWFTVVQSPKHHYLQSLRLESCRNKGARCFVEFVWLPKAILAPVCTQIYNECSFLVSASDGSGIRTIRVLLPTCCTCRYAPDPNADPDDD
ncbi:hypothetical protein PYW08_001796 [Mythimna loreyi]|uniref:Uncharacterized protein n=1 Tax=Mythimna loreyi TaxID=667449 RepID=A0ACC2R5M1_9NEOP|nr:hypothetical protein PYW08_001796 [Mythimna loreyi]